MVVIVVVVVVVVIIILFKVSKSLDVRFVNEQFNSS